MAAGEPYRELLHRLPVGIVVHAPDSRIVFGNHHAAALLGLSEAQLTGKTALDPVWHFVGEEGERLPPADYPVSRVMASGEAEIDRVLGVFRPDLGAVRWMLVSAFPEFDAGGALQSVLVNFYDISRLKQTEQALKERARQLQFVLEGAELGFWDWNIETGEVVRNERWAIMLGYEHHEIEHTTRQWADFVHPDDRERAWASIHAVLEGRAAQHRLEYRMCHKDGTFRWILDQAKVMERAADGRPLRMCGTHADVTERKLLEEAIRRQAEVDYLTGVFNRRHFVAAGETEIGRALRYGNELSILMMDVDYFKQVNDRHGHRVGDAVLRHLVEVCVGTLRSIDIVGRLGGEEFAVLLPETDCTAAVEVAERLREAIAAARVAVDGVPVQVTVSIGVAPMSSCDDDMDVLLGRADAALYEAKRGGRNRVCAAAPE